MKDVSEVISEVISKLATPGSDAEVQMNIKTDFKSEAERVAYHLFIQATDGQKDPADHPLAIMMLERAYELGVEHTLTSVNYH